MLPREILPPKVRFTFALKVANFLSPATSTTVTVVQKASLRAAAHPGRRPQDDDARREAAARARPTSLCDGLSLAERRMVIEWRENAASSPPTAAASCPRTHACSRCRGHARLRTTYRFEALVYMQQDPSINATSKCSVYVQPQPLVAGLDGGVERIVGADASLTLDASPSYDPDAVEGENATLAYAWSCANVSAMPATPCVDATGAPLQPALDAFGATNATVTSRRARSRRATATSSRCA